MIVSLFEDLRRAKAQKEKRKLSLRKMATETELSSNTIQRIRDGELERVPLSAINTLCRYFAVQSLQDLIQYLPDYIPDEEQLSTLGPVKWVKSE